MDDQVMDLLELDVEQRSYVRRMLFGGRVEVARPLAAADLVDDLMPLIGDAGARREPQRGFAELERRLRAVART